MYIVCFAFMYRDDIKLMWHTKIFNIKDKAYVEQNNSLSIEELSRWFKKKKM